MNIVQIAFLTILVTRTLLWFYWDTRLDKFIDDSLMGSWWHHFYTGLAIIGVVLLLKAEGHARTFGVGIGSGLMIDEAMLPWYSTGLTRYAYWSRRGIALVVSVFLIFAFFALWE